MSRSLRLLITATCLSVLAFIGVMAWDRFAPKPSDAEIAAAELRDACDAVLRQMEAQERWNVRDSVRCKSEGIITEEQVNAISATWKK